MIQNSEKASPAGLILANERAPLTYPEPGLQRQVLAYSPSMMLVRHQMTKGWRGAAHHHPHEQLVYVISGCIQIIVDGISRNAPAGDSFIVSSNVEHQAVALEDSMVLDIFTPAREDYV